MALDNGHHLLDLDFVLDHQNISDSVCDQILGTENKVIENVSLGNDLSLHNDINESFNERIPENDSGPNSYSQAPIVQHAEELLVETESNSDAVNQTFLSSESANLSDNESDFEELDLSAAIESEQNNVENASSNLGFDLKESHTVTEDHQRNFVHNSNETEAAKNTDDEELNVDANLHGQSDMQDKPYNDKSDLAEDDQRVTGKGIETVVNGTELQNDQNPVNEQIISENQESVGQSQSDKEHVSLNETENVEADKEHVSLNETENVEAGQIHHEANKDQVDVGEESMEEGEEEEEGEGDEGEGEIEEGEVDGEAASFQIQKDQEPTNEQTVGKLILKRKRKRRRKSAAKKWTRVSPWKKSGLTPSPRKRMKLDESVNEAPDVTVETSMQEKGECNENKINDSLNDTAESQGEEVDKDLNGTPDERIRRTSRPPSNRKDFYIDDDKLLEEMWKQTDHSVLYHKRRKTLLFNQGKKPKMADVKPLTDEEKEKYSLPFREGWKREIVIRGIQMDNPGKKNPPSDVYYFPPFGSKLRSMVQLTDWLKKHADKTTLTPDNFSFMRRPIGVDEGEVTRNAAMSRGRLSWSTVKKQKVKDKGDMHDDNDPLYDKPEIVIERDSDEFLNPIIDASINPQQSSPLKNLSPGRSRGRPKRKLLHIQPKRESIEEKPIIEVVQPSGEKCYISPVEKKIKSTARKSTTPRIVKQPKPYVGVENLCSMKCPGLEDVPPLLHCNVCMCLFHNQCVNYFGDDSNFTCLRCDNITSTDQTDGESMTSPTTEPMKLDPNLVKTLSKFPSGAKVIPPVTSSLLPTVIGMPSVNASPLFPFRPSLQENSNKGRINSPLLAQRLQSNSSKKNNIEIIKSSASDINMDLYIKEEPLDNSYPDYGEKETETPTTSVSATSALSNFLNSKFNTTSTPFPPLNLVSSNSKKKVDQKPSNIGANPLFTNNALIRLPNSNYQLIPVGPPVPMFNVRYPAGQRPKMFGNAKPPGNLTNLSMLRTPSPVPMTTIRTGSGMVSLIKTPSPVPIQVTSNNLLQITTASNPVESQGIATSITSPVSTTDSGVPTASPVVVNAKSCAPLNGQLLTLPPAVVKRLTLTKPLALKINNRQINVPPSGFFQTSCGLKVFLPPNTFPTAEDNIVPGIENKSPEKSNTTSAYDKGEESNTTDKLDSKISDSKESENRTKGNIRASKLYQKMCLIKMLFGAYDCMECIFKYLNLRDLISVGMVCKRWRTLAHAPSLWTHVSFNGMKVSDWRKATQFLNKRQVKSVNLMGLEHYSDVNRTWHQLVSSLQDLQFLQKIYFGIVPASVLHSLCSRMTKIESFCAEHIMDPTPESMSPAPTKIDIGKFACMSQLRELKIRGVHGLAPPSFSFSGGLSELGSLSYLEVLSVTSLHHVSEDNFHFMSQLLNIRELSLGNCTSWTQDTCERLGHLFGLEKLRLELGGEGCQNYIGEALSNLKNLHTLELRAFPVQENLGSHLSCLAKLKKLVLFPPYSHNIARDNMNALNAVSELKQLQTLEWILPDKKQLAIILDDTENSQDSTNNENTEYIPLLVTASLSEDEEIVAAHTEYINAKELKERLSEKLTKTMIVVKHCSVNDKVVDSND